MPLSGGRGDSAAGQGITARTQLGLSVLAVVALGASSALLAFAPEFALVAAGLIAVATVLLVPVVFAAFMGVVEASATTRLLGGSTWLLAFFSLRATTLGTRRSPRRERLPCSVWSPSLAPGQICCEDRPVRRRLRRHSGLMGGQLQRQPGDRGDRDPGRPRCSRPCRAWQQSASTPAASSTRAIAGCGSSAATPGTGRRCRSQILDGDFDEASREAPRARDRRAPCPTRSARSWRPRGRDRPTPRYADRETIVADRRAGSTNLGRARRAPRSGVPRRREQARRSTSLTDRSTRHFRPALMPRLSRQARGALGQDPGVVVQTAAAREAGSKRPPVRARDSCSRSRRCCLAARSSRSRPRWARRSGGAALLPGEADLRRLSAAGRLWLVLLVEALIVLAAGQFYRDRARRGPGGGQERVIATASGPLSGGFGDSELTTGLCLPSRSAALAARPDLVAASEFAGGLRPAVRCSSPWIVRRRCRAKSRLASGYAMRRVDGRSRPSNAHRR